VVQSVAALFDAAWRTAIDRAVYETSLTGLRTLAPSLLDALASGSEDEAAAARWACPCGRTGAGWPS
jgi:hypothetical protein